MRPSHASRERTLAQLREGYACGALETPTFARRVDAAFAAGTETELRGLTLDLPAATSPRLGRVRAVLSRLAPAPRPPSLLEAARGGELVLGRHPACALVLDDETVSRRHAMLCRRDAGWFLRDLESSNGTWVNGRRVVDAEVRPGDEVRLGDARLRL